MAAERWQRRIAQQGFVEYLRAQNLVEADVSRALLLAARESERLARLIISDSDSANVRRAMYAQRSKALYQQQQKLWAAVSKATADGIERTSQLASDLNEELLAYLTAKTNAQSATELVRSMEQAAKRGNELMRARLINDIELSPVVYKNNVLANQKVARVVNNGIATGQSSNEIAAAVRHLIRPDTPGGVSFAAKRLARTEINNAFHTNTVLSAQDQPWITGFEWELSGSHPKPDVCNEYAEEDKFRIGKGIFPKAQVPAKPHPQCLCYITALSVDDDEFFDSLFSGGYNTYLTDNLGFDSGL